MLRLLLPIVAALTLLAQPVTTWAGAGVVGDTACCCPDPHKCACHDRKDADRDGPQLKRCSTGAIELVAPVVLVALAPAAPPARVVPRARTALTWVPAALPERPADRPEKPPS